MKAQLSSLLFAAALLAGCNRGKDTATAQAAKRPDPVPIKVAAVQTKEVDRVISVTGSLEPDETVSVSAEVPGRIATILVDFGQPVRKGQVLAELDKQELTIAVEKSKAALAQALARVGLNPGQEEVTPESTPAMRQAQAQVEDAKFKFESASKLVKSGDISQERFTELEKAYHSRQAALEATRDELRTQMASVRALRADVRLAEKRLRDATLVAPFDGSVSQRLVAPGQYIKENTALLTLVKTNPLRLKLDVPEAATGAVRIGTTLTFTTDAAPGREFQAVVRQLNPSLDAKSRSLTAEARLVANDSRLRPGTFVVVKLVTDRNSAITVVPKQAVFTVAGLSKVFVVRSNKVNEVQIPPAQEGEDWVEVPGDRVRAGEQVAVSRLPQLFTGLEVAPQ